MEEAKSELTLEERRRRLQERLAQGIPMAKPKPKPMVVTEVSGRMVEAVRHNPAECQRMRRMAQQ